MLSKDKEVYILAESRDRRMKERGIRLRKLRKFLSRLEELRNQKTITRDKLLKKVGAAEKDAGRFSRLTEGEEAFRNLKGDLSIRPIYHQLERRIEAHIIVAFLAYCLHVTLRQLTRAHAPGLTPRSILEQMKMIQMIDVHMPTTDHRELKMSSIRSRTRLNSYC